MTKPIRPFDIDDKTLLGLALTEAINTNGQSLNIDPSVKDKVRDLASLPFNKAVDIASESLELHVSLNEVAYQTAMRKHRILNSEQEYYEWMISVGASNTLLNILFPSISNSTTNANYRRALGKNVTFAKVQLIQDTTITESIAKQYFELMKQIKLQPYERIRELYLHYQGKYNLTQLYAVLKEYDQI